MSQATKGVAKKWSLTLCLPKSTFPPRSTSADQARYLKRCTDDLYSWQHRERTSNDIFTLHDGPPYANGTLHIGHALNKILKDILCRTELRRGRKVNYVPGWDCHGLPIELKALNHQGWKRGEAVNPSGIRAAARKFAQGAVQEQMEGFRSWAVMGNWSGHWKTMDKNFELGQLSVFKALARNGLIYRAHKPVYWSPSSRSALAEAELEYNEDHISTAALVKLIVANPTSIRNIGSLADPISAVIWTTTPWTLPANQAIAVHKDLKYTIVRSRSHGLLVLAKPRLEFVEKLIKETLEPVIESLSGEELVGMRYSFFEMFDCDASTKPIIHANFVSAESGTGLVHCAPGHGLEDYEALRSLIDAGQVSVKAPVDYRGCFTDDAAPTQPGLLQGLNVLDDGNKKVLDNLGCGKVKNLVARHTHTHRYPYDWRTKEPIIIRATAQWFANVSTIRDETLQTLEHVRFHPPTGKSRLTSFVVNRSEWCISRQRAWGVPIPALYNLETGEAVLTDASISHIINTIRIRGTDAWWADPLDDPAWIPDYLKSHQGTTKLRRGTDTMDVWFDSGTSWTQLSSVQDDHKGRPADICIEGTDQHRGWFQSSLLTKVAYQKSVDGEAAPSAPFRSLITHGFTLDAQGKKMSKSIGNVISPDEIINGLPEADSKDPPKNKLKPKDKGSLGADALRLWVAGSDFTKDVTVSSTIVKTVHSALHRYRVIFKLLLGALRTFDPSQAILYEDLGLMDRVALFQLHIVSATIKDNCSDYDFYKAVANLNRYIAADLSGLYVESIKDILYCDGIDWTTRQSVQTVLYHVLCELQAILAPLTPLLVEESWAHTPPLIKQQQHAIPPHQRVWEAAPSEWDNEHIRLHLPCLLSINTAVKAAQERARAGKQMGSSLECDVILEFNDEHRREEDIARQYGQILSGMLVVSSVKFARQGSSSEAKGGDQERAPEWRHTEEIKLSQDGTVVGRASVQAPVGRKCARCWRYVVQKVVGMVDEEVDETCDRCEMAVRDNEKLGKAIG